MNTHDPSRHRAHRCAALVLTAQSNKNKQTTIESGPQQQESKPRESRKCLSKCVKAGCVPECYSFEGVALKVAVAAVNARTGTDAAFLPVPCY
jgi:hypothetical protein